MECQFCGRPTELVVGGMAICEGCYQDAGSCCAEFGGGDLWAERGREPAADRRPTAEPPPGAGSTVQEDG